MICQKWIRLPFRLSFLGSRPCSPVRWPRHSPLAARPHRSSWWGPPRTGQVAQVSLKPVGVPGARIKVEWRILRYRNSFMFFHDSYQIYFKQKGYRMGIMPITWPHHAASASLENAFFTRMPPFSASKSMPAPSTAETSVPRCWWT